MFIGKKISKRINKIFIFRNNDYCDKKIILFQISYNINYKQFILFDIINKELKYMVNFFNSFILIKITPTIIPLIYEFEFILGSFYENINNNQHYLNYSSLYNIYGINISNNLNIKDHLLLND